MGYYESVYDAAEAFKLKTSLSWPLTKALIETGKDLYEKGFYAVEHKYLLKNNLLVFNRSKKADSNFFVFVKAKNENEVDVFFSNPSMDEKIKRKELIKHFTIKNNRDVPLIKKEMDEIFLKIIEISEIKKRNEYWGCLHSHIGTINGERVWDDGITVDENWFLQSMLWHHDFHALTSHNWTHNEERLNWMNEMLSSANIVFIPGWENTTTIEDRIKSPHILVLCKDIQTAMSAKYEFLVQKLNANKEIVTPVLSGVPAPYTKHLDYLKKLHDEGKAAIIIAHPMSKDPGIDILDPQNIKLLGEKEAERILFEFADGVEQFNFKEIDSKEVDYSYILGMIENELGLRFKKLNNMMINYYVGEIAKKKGLYVVANQDDHYQPSIDSDLISDYSYGHNRLILSLSAYQYFKEMKRKFTSEEFVCALINKQFVTNKKKENETKQENNEIEKRDFELSPFAAVKIYPEKIELFESRKQSTIERIKFWINTQPTYIWNIAKLQFKYWFADKEQKKEIKSEIEKARAYNLK